MDFPHISDTQYPNIDNVNVFSYKNEFDYSRYTDNVKINLCNVNFDANYQHVVKFNSNADRDNYFNNITRDVYELKSEFHNQPLTSIKVPIPYATLLKFNYCFIDYPILTSESNPIEYASTDRVGRLYYFINGIQYLSPNATSCDLQLDVWTTYINNVTFNYGMLERGHAPMGGLSVEDFLLNPINNISKLGDTDVNFGNAQIVKSSTDYVFNTGTQYVCFVITSNPVGDWTEQTPATPYANVQGAMSYNVIAVSSTDISVFLNNVNSLAPQFYASVKGCFIISDSLITLSNSFSLFGVNAYIVNANRNNVLSNFRLTKSQFGYDEKYADIAKLYTSPYAILEINYSDDAILQVRIEDTTNSLAVSEMLQLTFPHIAIDTHILGLKTNNLVVRNITYQNLNQHSFAAIGKWYETLHSFNIPIYSIFQDNATTYDYSGRYVRAQLNNNAETARDNSHDSNDTAKTLETSAITNDGNILHNTQELQKRQNTRTNQKINDEKGYSNALIERNFQQSQESAIAATYDKAGDKARSVANAVLTSSPEYAAYSLIQHYAPAVTNAAQGAISNAAKGDAFGAVGSMGSVLGQLASDYVTIQMASIEHAAMIAASALASEGVAMVEQSNRDTADASKTANTLRALLSTNFNTNTMNDQQYTDSLNWNSHNKVLREKIRDDNYTLQELVKQRNYNNAINAIDNLVAQAALVAPNEYGTVTALENSVTRPIAISFNVVTQNENEIACAGDEMLRYGYYYRRYWNITNLQLMKHFTYWKFTDIYVNSNMCDKSVLGIIQNIFIDGVTIWDSNANIGNISIYNNMLEV